jgi:hypothetical protein
VEEPIMLHPEVRITLARQHHHDLTAEAASGRLAVAARGTRLPLSRRAARPLGRALLRMALALLFYGRADTPAMRVLALAFRGDGARLARGGRDAVGKP